MFPTHRNYDSGTCFSCDLLQPARVLFHLERNFVYTANTLSVKGSQVCQAEESCTDMLAKCLLCRNWQVASDGGSSDTCILSCFVHISFSLCNRKNDYEKDKDRPCTHGYVCTCACVHLCLHLCVYLHIHLCVHLCLHLHEHGQKSREDITCPTLSIPYPLRWYLSPNLELDGWSTLEILLSPPLTTVGLHGPCAAFCGS